MPMTDPLVSAEWLKSNLNAPDIRVVDASWVAPWAPDYGEGAARRLYELAHIPGAAFFDIEEIADQSSDLPHMMPSAELFSSRVRKLGLGDGNRLIIYDRGNFMASARVWWMFRTMGHKEVQVLDGGWQAWTREGGAIDDLPSPTSERHFTVRYQNHLIKSLEQMQDIVDAGGAGILDARSYGRFAGVEAEPREGLSSGHMPGSASLSMTSLIHPDGRFKSRDELAPLLTSFLESPNIVASCGSGVSAALILLAFHRLGRDDVALYDGSWTEWASQPEAKIAKLT